MIRQTAVFGGSGALLQPLTLVLLAVCGILLLVVPRRFAVVPFLLAVFLIPMSQRVVWLGLDFTAFRILVVLGLVRILATSDGRRLQWSSPIDRAVFWYSVAKVVTFTLLWMTMPALTNRLGYLVDDLGGYILLRSWIRDGSDVERALKVLGLLCLVFAGLMVYEYVFGQNPFSLLGSDQYSRMRDGRVRAQASFGHAILAGTFGATLFPIFYGYVIQPERRSRVLAVLATGASGVMVLVSHSSGPVLTLGLAIAGLLVWPFRGLTRVIKWVAILGLVGLHLVMNDPVWVLLFRISFIGGGHGYHRYQLIDQSINHFDEWWLLGTKDSGWWGIDMWDLANHYIACCVSGGLISLILFCLILHRTYVALRRLRVSAVATGDRTAEWRAWTFTNAVFAHAVAFFGISYWDQTKVLWLAFLALVVAITSGQERTRRAPAAIRIGRRAWRPRRSWHMEPIYVHQIRNHHSGPR